MWLQGSVHVRVLLCPPLICFFNTAASGDFLLLKLTGRLKCASKNTSSEKRDTEEQNLGSYLLLYFTVWAGVCELWGYTFPLLFLSEKQTFVLVLMCWWPTAISSGSTCCIYVISPLHQLREDWYQRSSGFKESLIKFQDSWSRIPAQGHWDPTWCFPVDLAFLGWPCPCPPLYCTLLSIPANDHDERPFISLLQPPQWNKSRFFSPPNITIFVFGVGQT